MSDADSRSDAPAPQVPDSQVPDPRAAAQQAAREAERAAHYAAALEAAIDATFKVETLGQRDTLDPHAEETCYVYATRTLYR
ncbi:MAG: hypothetical protein AAGF99_12930, partial [Bacteroidota bacterium]